jgi:hypothetical protein
VFNSFVRSLTKALRTLMEVTALNMILRSDARRGREDVLDVALSLPFQGDVNTGCGVLAKVYLDALTHLNGGARVSDANGEGVREAKIGALEICEETFPGVKSPKAEVERGFRFWDVVSTVSFFLSPLNESEMSGGAVPWCWVHSHGGMCCGNSRADLFVIAGVHGDTVAGGVWGVTGVEGCV